MSPRASMLGRMEERVKTDLRLPQTLVSQVEVVCGAIGVPKNAFFVMAASMMATQLSPLLSGKSQPLLLDEIEELFQKILSEAKRSAAKRNRMDVSKKNKRRK